MHPSHFQAMRLLIGQLAAQLQAAHQTTAQIHQTLAAAGQVQPQAPHVQQQIAQQQGFQGYMGAQEEALIDQAMVNAQQQAAQQVEAAMAGVMPHHPGRGGTRGFPGQHPAAQNGVQIPRHQPQMPQQSAPGIMGPGAFQSAAGSMLGGLGIDDILGNGGF